MKLSKKPDLEPIAGYRLVSPLGIGGFGEVWKCEAPGGLFKAIKFVQGRLNGLEVEGTAAREELNAINHIKEIRHPFLLSMERVELVDHELVIVMELADQNLEEVLLTHQAAGKRGIPREELLRYLREAAEVLDLLHLEHNLQHLDVKPRNLFLVQNHIKVADFGLVQSFNQHPPLPPEHSRESPLQKKPSTKPVLNAITPLYASPELFQGILTPYSDQYSLAIVYQELLTGKLPFQGRNARQLMLQHVLEKPDLSSLSEADQPIIAQALAKDPGQRFATCREMIEELERAQVAVTSSSKLASSKSALNDTVKPPDMSRTQRIAPSQSKVLPGYSFLRSLSRSPNLESWEAEDSEGRLKNVQFLYGLGARPSEKDAIALFGRLHHDSLLPREILAGGAGCLVVISDLIDTTLRTRYRECLNEGLRGIPRDELLDYLEQISRGLDELDQRVQVQHLELSPNNVVLEKGKAMMMDYGMAQLFWFPLGQTGPRATRYGAPELKKGRINRRCDQYSLAMIYEEMLTGYHAFRGRYAKAPTCTVNKVTSQQIERARTGGTPNLNPLSRADRAVLARALSRDASQRFPSCLDLIYALREAGEPEKSSVFEPGEEVDLNGSGASPSGSYQGSSTSGAGKICDLIASVQNRYLNEGMPRAQTEPTFVREDCLEGRVIAQIPERGALAKFEGFRQQWGADVVQVNSTGISLRVLRVSKGWLPWLRRRQGVIVDVRWGEQANRLTTNPEVIVTVTPWKKSKDSHELLQVFGTELIHSLLTHLQGKQEQRTSDRVYWPHVVQVQFLLNDRPIGESVSCQGKDLSPTGMGFYLPGHVPTSQVRLRLKNDALRNPMCVEGSVVRVQRFSNDLFEVGVRFVAE